MMTTPEPAPRPSSTPALDSLRWFGIGAVIAEVSRVYLDMFGDGAFVCSTLSGALALAFGIFPPPRMTRLRAVLVLAACIALVAAPALVGAFPSRIVPAAAVTLATGACLAFAPLLARQSLSLNALSALILLGGAGSAITLPVGAGVLIAVTSGAIAHALHGGRLESSLALRTGGFVNVGARTSIFSVVILTALLTLSCLRGPLSPAPAGSAAFAAALLLGLSLPAGRLTGALGAAGVAAVAFLALQLPTRMATVTVVLGRLSPALAGADHPALLVLAGAGASFGLLAGLARAGRPEKAVGVLFASLAAPLLTPLLPTNQSEHASSALVTIGADGPLRDRLDAARRSLPLQFARLGAFGGAVIRGRPGDLLAELDGAVVDPAARAAASERFAGTLAACLTTERSHARVGGDDMGAAVSSLLAQGFRTVDTGLPDTPWMQTWADLDPVAHAAWVHPGTRILTLPGSFVAQAGDPADVVVQIVRTGWTDARGALPSPASMAWTRRSLHPGGAYVLAVSTTRIDPDAFLGLAHALARKFPSVTVWLPPVGIDSALFVARTSTDPLPWSGLQACIEHDRQRLRRDAVRSPADVASLLLGDSSTIPERPAPSGFRLPQRLAAGDRNPLTAIEADGWDPATAWTADAPRDDLRARHASLLRFQAVIEQASSGDMHGAIEAARGLSTAPGGGRSVESLVRGYIDAARSHIAAAGREGPDSKEWAAAETALGNIRLLYPDLAEAWCVEGSMDTLRGQLPRAEEAYSTCAERDPDSLEALDGLGSTRRARGNLTGAEEAMRQAVERHPESWTPQLNLGVFYLSLGRMDEAEPLLKQAVASSSKEASPPLQPHLALAHLYLATDRPALALGEAQQVVSKRPDADALAVRGMARFNLNQLDLAENDFHEALKIRPDSVLARGGLGEVQLARGDFDGAVASFRAVLQVDPQNPDARKNLERLAEQGKGEE